MVSIGAEKARPNANENELRYEQAESVAGSLINSHVGWRTNITERMQILRQEMFIY
jgi:hypothetical protein